MKKKIKKETLNTSLLFHLSKLNERVQFATLSYLMGLGRVELFNKQLKDATDKFLEEIKK